MLNMSSIIMRNGPVTPSDMTRRSTTANAFTRKNWNRKTQFSKRELSEIPKFASKRKKNTENEKDT